MPYSSLLDLEPLSLWQSTADPNVHKKCSNTVLPQSLGPGVHKVCLSPLNDWQECGLILNVNSPLLPSYWGFSFALWGYFLTAAPARTVLLGFLWPWMWGISSQLHHSSATQLPSESDYWYSFVKIKYVWSCSLSIIRSFFSCLLQL